MSTILSTPISAEELSTYKTNLLDRKRTLTERFSILAELQVRLEVNQQEFATHQYRTNLERIKKDHELKIAHWDTELLELKTQFRQLDSRIIAAEQKMSRGIPDDLQILDKLITEQESIVRDQEKLNQAEADLLAHVRSLDVEYGRQQEKLAQQQHFTELQTDTRSLPTSDKFISLQKKSELLCRLTSIIAILALPLLLDYLTRKSGLSPKQDHWIVREHIVFLVSLILVEISMGQKIREFLMDLLIRPFFQKELEKSTAFFESSKAKSTLFKNTSD